MALIFTSNVFFPQNDFFYFLNCVCVFFFSFVSFVVLCVAWMSSTCRPRLLLHLAYALLYVLHFMLVNVSNKDKSESDFRSRNGSHIAIICSVLCAAYWHYFCFFFSVIIIDAYQFVLCVPIHVLQKCNLPYLHTKNKTNGICCAIEIISI